MIPNLWQRSAHKPEEHWTPPPPDVMSPGMPKQATHSLMKASTQSSVEVARRGMVSGHLVDLVTWWICPPR